MCVILRKLFKCGCKEVKSVDPCPMMDSALDLVDVQGVREDDIRVQRLEEQCADKSAVQYETQSRYCDLCNEAIAVVGMATWLAAKKERDVDEESRFHEEIACQDAAALPPRRKQLVDDDYIYDDKQDYEMRGGASSANVGTARRITLRKEKSSACFPRDDVHSESVFPHTQAEEKSTYKINLNAEHVQDKHDASSPADLEMVLLAALAPQLGRDKHYDGDHAYNFEDFNGISDSFSENSRRVSRSGAPSPSRGDNSKEPELNLPYKDKGKSKAIQ